MNAAAKARELSSGTVRGFRAADGRFDFDEAGPTWMMFEEMEDTVFWKPRTNETATLEGRAFALGEVAIENAATYALDGCLIIRESVRDWILARGNGIFVLDWRHAFDKLRNAPRIIVREGIRPIYRHHMHPPRMPQVFVLRDQPRD